MIHFARFAPENIVLFVQNGIQLNNFPRIVLDETRAVESEPESGTLKTRGRSRIWNRQILRNRSRSRQTFISRSRSQLISNNFVWKLLLELKFEELGIFEDPERAYEF